MNRIPAPLSNPGIPRWVTCPRKEFRAANSYLRARLGEACAAEGVKLFVPPPVLCTDNAAMIAARGYFSFAGGRDIADLSLNAVSNL